MCGVCGVVGRRVAAGGAAVDEMTDAMAHRGPDSGGTIILDGVALGARRLSIIGVHDGDQPLTSPCTAHALIVNGEIYNYVELREELRARGHVFGSASDGEVILHLYEEYGDDAVHRLRGMFAFALLDRHRRRMLLARDRMGEKPLYLYRAPEGWWVFASEVKALLRSGLVPFDINHRALRDYLHYQYVPEPETLLTGVRQLPAGELLAIDLDTLEATRRPYWDLEAAPAVSGDPAATLREALEDIGRIVVRSEAPIGVALSGGLDSAIVAALAHNNAPDVSAFSVGYAGRPGIDERGNATRTARAVGVPLQHLEIKPADVVDGFDAMVLGLDHPIADMAGPSYHALATAAAAHGCRVLLFGHGGDELFWGYRWVRTARGDMPDRAGLYRHMEVVRDSARLLPSLCDAGWWHAGRPADAAGDPAEGTAPDGTAPDVTQPVRITRLLADTYLRANGVAQTERLCMAHAVETRLPFLDHRFVEAVIGLRKTSADDGLEPKARLRAAAAGLVPPSVLNRRKTPFYTPTAAWHHALFTAYGERLTDGWLVANRVFTQGGAARAARGRTGVGSGTSISYKALLFETWHAAMHAVHRRAR